MKFILFFILIAALSIFLNVRTHSFANTNDAQQGKLWNLQRLEAVAETGNIEAQLRLISFYAQNINKADHYDERLEFWRQKLELNKQTPEYLAASQKLAKEAQDEQKRQLDLQAAIYARTQALQEKRNKMDKNVPESDAERFHDLLNAQFNLEGVYSWTTPYIWRYRYTINIETPEGVKSGSTVRELYFPPADKNIYAPSNLGIARGEAAYIDLGERGTVYAIMPDPSNASGAFGGLIGSVFPTVPLILDQSRKQELLAHYHELKGVKGEAPSWSYPMFVHFKEQDYPQSIELIYKRKNGSRKDKQQTEVDRFEEIFGEGVHIKNITLEMTNDPLEWKLDDKLEWMKTMTEDDITQALNRAHPRIHMANGIAYYVLRQAQQDPWQKIKDEKKAAKKVRDTLSKYRPYASYDEIPSHLRMHLHMTMTFNKYLESINKGEQRITNRSRTEAIRSFATVDTNKDGTISYAESEAWSQHTRRKPRQ